MRILLVDDEPALRELLRVTFADAHVEVSEAASGEEAAAAIAQQLPDVVVLDLRLPGLDGVELCGRLRREERTRRLPVVLLTGADGEELARARACGADAVMRKPFSPLELLAVVERLAGSGGLAPRPAPLRESREGEELLLYARDLRLLLDVERRQREELAASYRATVTALANALETKDTGTGRHSQRVQCYATALLRAVDPTLVDDDPGTEYGFLLHDVGKIGIPDTILRKPGRLTVEERLRMELHTVLGEQMLSGIPFLRGSAVRIVRSHHERWDGRGYPDGLAGDEIPLAARAFAIADSLDAMTSDRPYRRALSWEVAREEIVRESGRQFDPLVVDAFRACERELRETRSELVAA
ncbi:MAG TPA: HD domain-containing phosphohydrolase [Gaiellaceae bacterium]|nr:HD domain-containing phosphohydrolase [Gaiellaceae bacterium]